MRLLSISNIVIVTFCEGRLVGGGGGAAAEGCRRETKSWFLQNICYHDDHSCGVVNFVVRESHLYPCQVIHSDFDEHLLGEEGVEEGGGWLHSSQPDRRQPS